MLRVAFYLSMIGHLEWRSSNSFVTFVVCVAVFTDIFLYGLIVPVLPFALKHRVGIEESQLQSWVSVLLASYGASILLGSLVFGWIGDRTRHKKLLFLLGLLVVGTATLLFSLATSLPLMVFARVLQGLSTASVFTVGFILLLDAVGNQRIGRALGLTSMCISLGLFAGPIIGGVLYDIAGYLAVFAPAFALILAEITLCLLLVEPAAQVACLGDSPEHSMLLNRSVPNKKPVQAYAILLRVPRFVVAMLGMCALNVFMTAFEAVLPVYLHEVFSYRSSEVALVFLSNTIPLTLFSPITGDYIDRTGSFRPALVGFAVIAPSMMLLGFVRKDTIRNAIVLRVALFFFGWGVSMAMPAMMTEISMATEAVERQRPGVFGARSAYAQAYGLSNAAFAAGTLAGPLYAGGVRQWAGWAVMTVSMGLWAILMAFLVAIFTRRRHSEEAES